VIAFGETAIAEAARPALGDAGYTVMAITAMIATTGSTNATLYAAGGLTSMLADAGQFPPLFGRKSRLGPKAGLWISAALMLVLANFVDLSAIASMGSAISLCVFVAIGFAGYRLRASTGARGPIVILGIIVTVIVLAFFAVDTARNAPETFAGIIGVGLLAVLLDFAWSRRRSRLAPSEAVGA